MIIDWGGLYSGVQYYTGGAKAWVWTGGNVTFLTVVPTIPGIEFTWGGDRMHYRYEGDRMHYTWGGDRLHYRLKEE